MRYIFIVASLFLIIGCSNTNEPEEIPDDTTNAVEKSDVSVSFSEIEVIVENKTLYVTGDARTELNSFYYTVEQGSESIIEETEVELEEKTGEWRAFEIKTGLAGIDPDDDEVPIIKLYIKDGDRTINPNYVPIDLLFY